MLRSDNGSTQSAVFDDLAHEIVHQTTSSLVQASSQVKTRASLVDSQLFLMKHLLILKSQIVAFDFEYVTPEVSFDFSNVTNTFWELRERGGLFSARNLLRLVGGGLLPRVVESMLDAKVELDGRLRTVINDFTNGIAASITADLSEAGLRKRNLDAATAVQAVREGLERESPLLRKRLDDYLDDVRTKETLVMAVHEQIVENYERFYDRYKTGRGQLNGKHITAKGSKGRENEVWDPDTFAEWAGKVFELGKINPYQPGEDNDHDHDVDDDDDDNGEDDDDDGSDNIKEAGTV